MSWIFKYRSLLSVGLIGVVFASIAVAMVLRTKPNPSETQKQEFTTGQVTTPEEVLPSPSPVETAMPAVTQSPQISPKPISMPSPKPSPTPSPIPLPTPDDFDLHLESILFSSAPMVSESSWHEIPNAIGVSHLELKKLTSPYAPSVWIRNNGHEAAENVVIEMTVDSVSTRKTKDRIDPQTHYGERLDNLPDDDTVHRVKIVISSSHTEGNLGNNSHEFTYQIR